MSRVMTIIGKGIKGLVHPAFVASGTFAACGECSIDCYSMQPGWKSGLTPESVELANHLQQNVLRYIFGVGIVTKHALGKIVHPWSVFPKHAFRRQFANRGLRHSRNSGLKD